MRKLFQKLSLYINVYNVIYIYPSSYTIEVFICINRVIYFSRNKKVFSIIFLQEYLMYLDILLCISSILGWPFVHFFLGLLIVILSKNIDEMCKFTWKNDFKTVRHRFFKYNIGKMVNLSIKTRWKYLYCSSTKVE